MRYDSEKQRKLNFTGCCEDLERLIGKEYTSLHMFERYSHAIGIIVIHRHYDPERVDKIMAVVHESVEKREESE